MKRRDFLKLVASGAILAGAGLTGLSLPKKREISARELWHNHINQEGILITEDVLMKYPISIEKKNIFNSQKPQKEKLELDKRLLAKATEEERVFEQDAVPENYTEGVFLRYILTANNNSNLFLKPMEIAQLFNLYPNHQLINELKEHIQKEKSELVKLILSCSLLITQEKLEPSEKTLGDSQNEFMEHIKNNIGDCTEYTYATANNFYAACSYLKRQDLAGKIRIILGAGINQDKKLETVHSWIEMYANNKWNCVETHKSDKISKNQKISLSTPALYEFDSKEEIFMVPFISTRVELDNQNKGIAKYYAHILPK